MKKTLSTLTLILSFFALLTSVSCKKDDLPESKTIIEEPIPSTEEDDKQFKINITNLENGDGNMSVALFNTQDGYENDNDFYTAVVYELESENFEAVLLNIPEGEYAISVYHDENSNNELDKALLGYPKEAYGFSNNPGKSLGKPSFEDVKFTITDEKIQTISIELIKW